MKKNWYDNIGKGSFLPRTRDIPAMGFDLFDELYPHGAAFPVGESLMADLEGFGFQDKGDRYEMVTNLGGQHGEGQVPEDALKVEITGELRRLVEITYEHSTSEDDAFYSHSQKTSVMLPSDADEETLKAWLDDDDNVVVSVMKKQPKKELPKTRTIQVKR